MADTPIPHFFEGGYISADDWKEFRQFLNPSMESVNLVIEDRKDFLKEGGHESGGGFHTILVQRDLIGDDYQSRLLINTYTSRDSTINTKDQTILSFSNSEKDGKNFQGVRLNVRGNGETYEIHIITNDMAYYGDFYSASFQADSDWKMIELPFNSFERKRFNAPKLEAKNIRSFAIAAYGRDFTSDVSVSTIEFYY